MPVARHFLVLGDALFADLSAIPPDATVHLCEDWGLCTRVRHHQHKLTLFLSAMRHYDLRLRSMGRRVRYGRLDPGAPPILRRVLGQVQPGDELHTHRANDRFLRDELHAACEARGVVLTEHRSQAFLTSSEEWASYARTHSRRHMAEFYVWQRKRFGLLLDPSGQPQGGRWSFDHDNREPIPPGLQAPGVAWTAPDEITREVVRLVKTAFPGHPGDAASFGLPVDHEGAGAWLDRFLQERLPRFGPHEDAISRDQNVLWHSLLSPLLNAGLLTPGQVLATAMCRWSEGGVPLASMEGFVRQIIGWREFVNGISGEYDGRERLNPLGQSRRLTEAWYAGKTGLPPLDTAILRARLNGWCHHIERLMVIGAAMLMSDVHPDEAYRWFMEMFVDSADWVMAPNVFGMSQYADGGLFATKPYISGSAYLRRMSDHPAGEWCDVWDGLYWRFLNRRRKMLASNRRMAPMLGGLDRLKPARKERLFTAAESFIASKTHGPPCPC